MRTPAVIIFVTILSAAWTLTGCKEQTWEEKAFNDAKRYADTGNYQGLLLLGTHYEEGNGTVKDPNMALSCFARAFELMQVEKLKLPTTLDGWKHLADEESHERKIDYLIGLYYDGMIHENYGDIKMKTPSLGTHHDNHEARNWYEKSVKEEWNIGHPDAYMRLAELCESEAAASKYLQKASNKGSLEAKYELANGLIYANRNEYIYEKGKRRVVILNEQEGKFTRDTSRLFDGLRLMKESSELGCWIASSSLSEIYSDWRRNSPLGRDEKLTWYYRRKKDEQELSSSEYRLWFLSWRKAPSLASMLPYSKEGEETVLKHRIGSLKGDPASMFALSVCYYYGKCVRQDSSEALRRCKQSASLGYPLALLSMGNRYYDGNGVIKDEIEAYAYWNLAGITTKEGREYVEEIERKLSEPTRLLGQKRSRELQAEIEANKAKANNK
jgi:TPR repeat protein